MRSRIHLDERKKFEDQGAASDKLFHEDHTHPKEFANEDCETSCIQNGFRTRQDRGIAAERKQDTPKIHYGYIASSNQLHISASKRNKLQNLFGVICFEMEGAGVTSNHPCLVVRGICDYSDSHKNRKWRPCAAATAAAYAKGILEVIPASITAQTRPLAEQDKKYGKCDAGSAGTCKLGLTDGRSEMAVGEQWHPEKESAPNGPQQDSWLTAKSGETRNMEEESLPNEQQQAYISGLAAPSESKIIEKGSRVIEQQYPPVAPEPISGDPSNGTAYSRERGLGPTRQQGLAVPPETVSGDSGYSTGFSGLDQQYPDFAIRSVAGESMMDLPKMDNMIDIFANGLRHSLGPRFDPITSTLNIEETLPDLLSDFAVNVLQNTQEPLERNAAMFVRRKRV